MWHSYGYEVGVLFLQYNNEISRYSNQAARCYSRKEAFETEDFVWHMRMMDAVISGLDRALVGFTSVPIFSYLYQRPDL